MYKLQKLRSHFLSHFIRGHAWRSSVAILSVRSCGTRAELVVCGGAVMRDARPWLFIFAVLSAVLRSGFRDTGHKYTNATAFSNAAMRFIRPADETMRTANPVRYFANHTWHACDVTSNQRPSSHITGLPVRKLPHPILKPQLRSNLRSNFGFKPNLPKLIWTIRF